MTALFLSLILQQPRTNEAADSPSATRTFLRSVFETNAERLREGRCTIHVDFSLADAGRSMEMKVEQAWRGKDRDLQVWIHDPDALSQPTKFPRPINGRKNPDFRITHAGDACYTLSYEKATLGVTPRNPEAETRSIWDLRPDVAYYHGGPPRLMTGGNWLMYTGTGRVDPRSVSEVKKEGKDIVFLRHDPDAELRLRFDADAGFHPVTLEYRSGTGKRGSENRRADLIWRKASNGVFYLKDMKFIQYVRNTSAPNMIYRLTTDSIDLTPLPADYFKHDAILRRSPKGTEWADFRGKGERGGIIGGSKKTVPADPAAGLIDAIKSGSFLKSRP